MTCPKCGGRGPWRPAGCAPWCSLLVLEPRKVRFPLASRPGKCLFLTVPKETL